VASLGSGALRRCDPIREDERSAGAQPRERLLGTSARSRVLTDWPAGGFIGIHGTDEPALIPGPSRTAASACAIATLSVSPG
jgi:hypothetical protein